MAPDLSIRLYAEAVRSSRAASAAASISIIGSHTRELREFSEDAEPASPTPLPLPPGEATLDKLAQGASGVLDIKAGRGGRHA